MRTSGYVRLNGKTFSWRWDESCGELSVTVHYPLWEWPEDQVKSLARRVRDFHPVAPTAEELAEASNLIPEAVLKARDEYWGEISQ